MASKSDTMSLIHELTAQQMLDMLKNGVDYESKDGTMKKRKVNAAELSAITKFLKDNNISADPEFNKTLQAFTEDLPFKMEGGVEFRQ